MMKLQKHTLEITTTLPIQIIDITEKISIWLKQLSEPLSGHLLIATQHTTAAIRINEKCAALEQDFLKLVQQWVPPLGNYDHNKVAIDGRPNAHSHLLAYFMSPSQTVAVINNQLQLGVWQKIFFLELDGPREMRKIELSLLS